MSSKTAGYELNLFKSYDNQISLVWRLPHTPSASHVLSRWLKRISYGTYHSNQENGRYLALCIKYRSMFRSSVSRWGALNSYASLNLRWARIAKDAPLLRYRPNDQVVSSIRSDSGFYIWLQGSVSFLLHSDSQLLTILDWEMFACHFKQ